MIRYKIYFADVDSFYACPATKDLIISSMPHTLIEDLFLAGWYLFTEMGFGIEGPVDTEEELWDFHSSDYLEIQPLPAGHVYS